MSLYSRSIFLPFRALWKNRNTLLSRTSIIVTAEDDPQPENMTVHFDVSGSAHKALANAIGEAIGAYPSYKAAPSFAYIIGKYTLDRNGVLTGLCNSQLLIALDQDGYRTK